MRNADLIAKRRAKRVVPPMYMTPKEREAWLRGQLPSPEPDEDGLETRRTRCRERAVTTALRQAAAAQYRAEKAEARVVEAFRELGELRAEVKQLGQQLVRLCELVNRIQQ